MLASGPVLAPIAPVPAVGPVLCVLPVRAIGHKGEGHLGHAVLGLCCLASALHGWGRQWDGGQTERVTHWYTHIHAHSCTLNTNIVE